MTRAEAAKLVAILMAAFPHGAITEKTSEVYETLLADLDFETAKKACARLIATSRFLPSIAEIRAAATELEHGPRRLGSEAWGDVVEAIHRVGSYRIPRFDDPCVAEVVKRLGWRNLALEGTNDSADRARFVELYDQLQARAQLDVVSGQALPPPRSYVALPPPTAKPSAAFRALLGGIGRKPA